MLSVLSVLSGCVTPPPAPVVTPPPVVLPAAPLTTNRFEFDPAVDDVVGEIQITKTTAEDTLSDVARRFNLGFEELVRANPNVSPWLPGEGTEVILPTQFVLPDAPREGLVVNLAQLRVFYFPKRKPNEPQVVETFPIGIGKVGWSTPVGSTKVIGKVKDPIWTPPASVRKEHLENDDPLPPRVPAGPDNPLGAYMMRLGWPSYLIHGTNKPYGVGMRSSHGCMRLYPEDIERLFSLMPVGTKVHVVNQPVVFGWRRDVLHVQVFPKLEDDKSAPVVVEKRVEELLAKKAELHSSTVDNALVDRLVTERRGIAMPVTMALTFDNYVAGARRVDNRLPDGATWDGKDELLVSNEEYESRKSGAEVKNTSSGTAKKKSVAQAKKTGVAKR
jgi:L,D-transpeptidase ErfK/SrfK